MSYEINVALNGKHLFATNERSCRDADSTQKVLEILLVRFPRDEGYTITCSYDPGISTSVDLPKITPGIEVKTLVTKALKMLSKD